MSCPICGEETVRRWRPFCSSRCADRDLGRWLNGAYAIPSHDPEEAEQARQEAAADPASDPGRRH